MYNNKYQCHITACHTYHLPANNSNIPKLLNKSHAKKAYWKILESFVQNKTEQIAVCYSYHLPTIIS